MKKLTLLTVHYLLLTTYCLLLTIYTQAQGTILSFYTLPASPTVNDQVKVVVNLSFTSGDCPLSDRNHTTSGAQTDAYTLHCVGFLTVICNTTDTFNLGTLPEGNHTFNLTLSSGSGSVPCSPGIVPDDNATFNFTVDPGVGINSAQTATTAFTLYPNPARSSITLNCEMRIKNCELKITNTSGQLVHQSAIKNPQSEIDVSQLTPGLYYLTLENDEGMAVKKFEVVR